MVELLKYLASHLAFLFSPDGYRIVDSQVSPSFGGDAMIVLESSLVRMRLTWDRAQLLMEFQPINGRPSEWFSPGLLHGLLTGERPSSEVLDRRWAKFLASGLPELERRLKDPDEAERTITELRQQARLRARELFG